MAQRRCNQMYAGTDKSSSDYRTDTAGSNGRAEKASSDDCHTDKA